MLPIIKHNLDGKHNYWILSYLMDENIFIGWIKETTFSVNKLKELGVYGPMQRKWKWTGPVVEKCIVTKEIGQKLKSLGVDMGSFTENDKYGKQVSWGGKGL